MKYPPSMVLAGAGEAAPEGVHSGSGAEGHEMVSKRQWELKSHMLEASKCTIRKGKPQQGGEKALNSVAFFNSKSPQSSLCSPPLLDRSPQIMTLKSVLRALQEVFPQIDLRILRAVAVEFSKDADAAVEFVLSDVLPIINEPAEASYNPNVDFDAGQWPNVGVYSHDKGTNEANLLSRHDEIVEQKESLLASEPRTVQSEMKPVTEQKNNDHQKPHSDEIHSGNCSNVLSKDPVLDIKNEKAVKSSDVVDLLQISGAKCDFLDANNQELCNMNINGTIEIFSHFGSSLPFQSFHNYPDPMKSEAEMKNDLNSCITEYEKESFGSVKNAAMIQDKCNYGANNMSAAFTSAEVTPSAHAISKVPDTDFQSDSEIQEPVHLSENGAELFHLGNASLSVINKLPTKTITAQEDICEMDFLGGAALDAQDTKRTLVSALESTNIMLREVKHHEETTDITKKEVTMACHDVLKKVDDLRQMIMHAKVTNDKTAGEIYAEKSTLASEAWELQSRLTNISGEAEKSLSIIGEIHQTLDARLSAAKEEQAAAEKEKLEKEKLAHKILNEQEGIMDSLVQEAKHLQKEAEENAKLRAFLTDRSHILNILQGEIAAACADVTSLKDRVDDCMPKETPISTRTGYLVSSTSSSSEKFALSGSVHHHLESDNSSMIDQEAKDPPMECYNHHDKKEQSDDDWEILEFGK
ncbi:hypothetical protein Cni_G05532 [Canna indica]|uniref:CUE domain-containing protein n=1 Tax=Canna indica TaxID=4628 RepID=A0AAQ3JX52_9LILI|nr:hypothetical protein Cni_G05532 [Canna indica]